MNSAHSHALSRALRLDWPKHIAFHRHLGTTGTVRAFPTAAETEAELMALCPQTARAWGVVMGRSVKSAHV